ncbi:MAG: glutathione S-transferase family protein [Thermoleophilia bacterium]
MPLTLYDNALSTNAQKVRFLLAELDLPYEAIAVDMGSLCPDWYRQRHPFATIPLLVDDGFAIFESNTMLRYLADREGRDDLYPVDPVERARIDQVMDALSLSVRPALWELEAATIYCRVPSHLGGDDGSSADPAAVAAALTALAPALEGFEQLLAELGGFGIADCAIAGRFATAPKLPLDLTVWPELEARLRTAWSLPAWTAGLAAAAR